MPDVFEQGAILIAKPFPVISVHIFYVKVVPIAPPDLIEDLRPFFARDTVDPKAVGRDGLA